MKTPWTLLLTSFAMTLISAALLAPFPFGPQQQRGFGDH